MRSLKIPDKSGIALVAVLLGLALIGAVAATVVGVSVVEYQTSRDYLAAAKARLVANAGVAHTVAVVGGPLAARSFDEILIGADGAGTGNGASCGAGDPSAPADIQCSMPADAEQMGIDTCYDLYLMCQDIPVDSDYYIIYGCSQFEGIVLDSVPSSYDWECIDDDGDDGVLAGFPELDASDEIVQTGVAYHDGDYQVRLVNDIADPSGSPFVDTNFRVAATARATSDDGGEAEVKVMLEAPPYPAVVVNGDVRLNANVQITGPCAGIHANGWLEVPSTAVIDGPMTAVDTVRHWFTDPSILERIESYAPEIEVPRYNPLDYCSDADYILRNGWKINMTATPDSTLLGGSTDWTWRQNGNTYKLGSSTTDLGTFCVHGNVSYTASMGTDTEPVPISLIATGSVSLGGRSRIAPAHPDNILIMAGGDVDIGGQAGAFYSGLIWTENQCVLQGGPAVDALLLCYNDPDPAGDGDITDYNEMGGSSFLRYDCSGPRQRPRITAWWE